MKVVSFSPLPISLQFVFVGYPFFLHLQWQPVAGIVKVVQQLQAFRTLVQGTSLLSSTITGVVAALPVIQS